MKKFGFCAVAIFWAVMMYLLVRSEAGVSVDEAFYREFVRGGTTDREVVMDIYWNGKKVGESKTLRTLSANGGTIQNETKFSVQESASGDVRFMTIAQIDKEFRVQHLVGVASFGGGEISLRGRADGDDLVVYITGMGEPKTFRMPNPGAVAFASGPVPAIAARNAEVGSQWEVPLLDFMSMKIVKGRARVVDRQKILWKGDLHDCSRVIVTDELGRKMLSAWCDRKGRVLKMEFSGIKFVRAGP